MNKEIRDNLTDKATRLSAVINDPTVAFEERMNAITELGKIEDMLSKDRNDRSVLKDREERLELEEVSKKTGNAVAIAGAVVGAATGVGGLVLSSQAWKRAEEIEADGVAKTPRLRKIFDSVKWPFGKKG